MKKRNKKQENGITLKWAILEVSCPLRAKSQFHKKIVILFGRLKKRKMKKKKKK